MPVNSLPCCVHVVDCAIVCVSEIWQARPFSLKGEGSSKGHIG